MKLNFRDLKQQKFTIDAEPSETIGEVKNKIAEEKGWEAASQKLIYSGKILADANTVESYNIEEKGFIVCMVSKPKAAPAPKAVPPPATPAQTASTPAQPPAPQQSTSTSNVNPPATPTPAQSTATTTTSGGQEVSGFGDPSAMLVGNRNEATIRQMEAMGFGRAEIDRALRAAFFNPDRAIDYLLSGIPEDVQTEQQQPPQQRQQQPATAQQPASPSPALAQPASTAPQTESEESVNLFEAAAQAGSGRTTGGRGGIGAGAGTTTGTGGTAGTGAAGQGQAGIDFLRNSPHFHQLRQLVQQQPAMLEPILQQLAENNPQLAQMIGQNQEQFLQLLSEDTEGGHPPLGTMQVTAQEAEAIARLCDLGFSRDRVIQAYFACDKNEELAANFLFEQPDDDEDDHLPLN